MYNLSFSSCYNCIISIFGARDTQAVIYNKKDTYKKNYYLFMMNKLFECRAFIM